MAKSELLLMDYLKLLPLVHKMSILLSWVKDPKKM